MADERKILEMLQQRNQPEQVEPSAIEQYQERLKTGPSDQERWSRVLAAAADTFGGGGGIFTRLQQAQGSETDRLEKAAKLELAQNKATEKYSRLQQKVQDKKATKKESENFRRRSKDESMFVKAMAQLETTGRGTTFSRKVREELMSAKLVQNRLDAIEDGTLTADKQTATEISNAVSRLIAGGQPAIQLVDATLYHSLGGEANDWAQWISGNPQEYMNTLQRKEIRSQINNIEKTKRDEYNDWRVGIKGSVNFILNRNKDLNEEFNAFHPDLAEVNKRDKIEAVSTKKAPHGQRVRQGGVNYVWNGSEYVREQ